MRYSKVDVDGVEIFFREAGPSDAPALLLLHGFPSSSHMFRNLMPLVSDRYRVIAPDYPGFGQSAFPDRNSFSYTFDSFARIIARFIEKIGLQRFSIYIQDYGAPVGLRLALAYPERIAGLVVQNGNAYEEGLSQAWSPLRDYWQDPTPLKRERLRGWLDAEGVRQQYVGGVPARLLPLFSPDTWTLDWALLQRPGNLEVQLDLFYDYRTNLSLYPEFHDFFRRYQRPTLIIWGRHDPFFTTAGAEAYLRDLPHAELHYLDSGHFALETHSRQVAGLIRTFLASAETALLEHA